MDFGRKDVLKARERVYTLAYPTPLVEEDPLSHRFGGKVLSKLENLQNSGSFKIRGAASKVLSLDPSKTGGVNAASAGNHARGVARAARAVGIPATLVMPVWAPVSKSAAAQREGGESVRIVLHGDTFEEASRHADDLAKESRLTVVHPYDDPLVIAGQGTLGLEIVEAAGPPGTVYVPVGGGGLLAGIGAAIKEKHPKIDGTRFLSLPLLCRCGERMRVVGFITQAPVIRKILDHIGRRFDPLKLPGRAPPLGDDFFPDPFPRTYGPQ